MIAGIVIGSIFGVVLIVVLAIIIKKQCANRGYGGGCNNIGCSS